jgi:hypothetical protein
MELKPITQRIISDLSYFELTENQILGFLFHLGYTVDQHAKYIGVYGSKGVEVGLMESNPFSYLLDNNFEVEDNQLSHESEEIRSCYYTFAKVIHEVWVESEIALDTFINVGPQFLFTGEIHEEIWKRNEGTPFLGVNIDEGVLVFFECIGNELSERGITDFNECLWYGHDLYFGSAMDDNRSFSYVVDKINTVMSPFLKMFLTYPINVEVNKVSFEETDLYTNVFRASSKIDDNTQRRNLSVQCQKDTMFDSEGNLYENYNVDEQSMGHLLMQLAYDGFQFKYSLNSIQYKEVQNAGNVLKLEEFEGKDIDLGTYASIIAQITHMQFGYDYRENSWLNRGVYYQFLAFYFMLAMRYSVFLENLIEKE